ncbi:MAG: BadF/BadG/BcrA/BcrD ATPase family protein [Isosphaeraceae bacterium]
MTEPHHEGPEFVIGVDGGGTSTSAWLARFDGTVVGRGKAGPSNAKAVGLAAARAALDEAIAGAFADAGAPRSTVRAACLGVAGFDRPEDRAVLESWSSESGWAAELILVNDGDLVVAAGTPDGWGVGVISGTGSIAVGRARDGRKSRAGGWGYLMGDEGSAYDVVLSAFRLVARHFDGREAGDTALESLTASLCEALDVDAPPGIVRAIYRPEFDRTRIAGLAPVVLEAARRHPSLCERLLRPAGISLADQAIAVAQALAFARGNLPLAIAGGFLLSAPEVVDALVERMSGSGFVARPNRVPEPARGAVVLANRHLGRPD